MPLGHTSLYSSQSFQAALGEWQCLMLHGCFSIPNFVPQSHLHPKVVCSKVVIPTQKKMVPMSWLVAHWSYPTHMASASRKGTAMVPLKHVR